MTKAVADFTVDSQDLFLFAVNQVRRDAELLHDFEFSRKLVDLTVDGVTGGSLDDVTLDSVRADTLNVAGTLSSAGTGTYYRVNFGLTSYPVYIQLGSDSSNSYILAYDTDNSRWQLEKFPGFGGVEADFYTLAGTSPIGTYTTQGAATGAPIVTVANDWTLKTIIDMGLYDDEDNLRPAEWTTVAEGLERTRGESRFYRPRYPTDQELNSGVTGCPRFELSGNTLFKFPKDETNDYTVGLEIYTFQNDWTAYTAPEDEWLKYGHKYLTWGVICFLNHRFKTFVYRQEGNLAPPEKYRDEGLAAFIEWDASMYETNRRHGR